MAPNHINASNLLYVRLSLVTISRRAKLVCGCFSSDPAKSKMSGNYFGLQRNRIYKSSSLNVLFINSYTDMFHRENELPENERMNVVIVATPTATHYHIVLSALEVNLNKDD